MQVGFDVRGRVVSLEWSGKEFIDAGSACELFEAQFRDMVGSPHCVSSGQFRQVKQVIHPDGVDLHFSDCEPLPAVEATVMVRNVHEELHWEIALTPHAASECRLEFVEFPRMTWRKFPGGRYLLPNGEGCLVEDMARREAEGAKSFGCNEAEYPMTGVSPFYPGPVAAQFEAFCTPEGGLFLLCADPSHAPKSIDMHTEGTGVRPYLQLFTGGENTPGFPVVLRGFHGDWQDAAELYRDWMEANDNTLPPKLQEHLPPVLAASPVVVAYPVKGRGKDTGDLNANEYYPYINALPVLERLGARWDVPVLALLMHWEGTAPWAPPYVWPPEGGEDALKSFLDAMHERGNFVGLYGSGIAWTQRSMIDPRYDCRQRFEEEHVEREICKGPRGEAFSRVCNGPLGQRIGYDLCAGRQFTAKVVAQEIGAASRLGVDYLQYFDQNQGCAAPLCYSAEHGHPSLPGAWQTADMRRLLSCAAQAAGDTVVGCENAAAEPYMATCRLNDSRWHLAWNMGGIPVPLHSYLFHEYTANFSGNEVWLHGTLDRGRTPFLVQWILAWHFVCGNLLSVILKDGGKLHWNWCLHWDFPEPEQEPLHQLLANLCWWRRGPAAPFLIAGRMRKTPPLQCGTRDIHLNSGKTVPVPAVASCAWQSADGCRAIVFANCGKHSESCRIDFPEETSGRLRLRTNENDTLIHGTSLEFQVPPCDAALFFINP